MKFDLNLFSSTGQPVSEFFTLSAPRRSARGREDDQIFFFLTQQGDDPLVGEALVRMQWKLGEAFYKTIGSVTTAMRGLMNTLNQSLAERNKKKTPKDIPTSAEISVGVIRNGNLFIGQVGKTQGILIHAEGQTVFEDSEADPLGMNGSETYKVKFFQHALQDGDILLLASQLADELRTALETGNLLGMVSGLKSLQPLEMPAAAVQFVKGTGRVAFGDMKAEDPNAPIKTEAEEILQVEGNTETLMPQEDESLPLEEPSVDNPQEDVEEGNSQEPTFNEVVDDLPEPEEGTSLAEDLFGNIPLAPVEQVQGKEKSFLDYELSPSGIPAIPPEAPELSAEPVSMDESVKLEEELDKTDPAVDVEKLKKGALKGVAKGASWLKGIEIKTERALTRTEMDSTGQTKEVSLLSPWVKLIIALLVPVLLVALATGIYITQGRTDEFDVSMSQVKAAVSSAEDIQNSQESRAAWEAALVLMDQAGAYGSSDELTGLRVRAQTILDSMDGAVRLTYNPAYAAGSLPNLQISKLVLLNNDLYVLDMAEGAILHFNQTNTGFTLDENFSCEPGYITGVNLGKLVDMVTVPINNPARAPILGIDGEGNTVYCGIGRDPVATSLIAPDGGFGRIQSVTFDSGRLFVLDPVKNALWIYRGFASQFDQPPDSYYEDEPVKLGNAVEAAVGGDELFVLYEDGHSSHCLASYVMGTIDCQDPITYTDERSGVPHQDFTLNHFGSLAYSPPPDPSIYYLDTQSRELYQFSLKLNLNRVLRAASSQGMLPKKDVSAFYVSSNRYVFLAFGNDLYYALLP